MTDLDVLDPAAGEEPAVWRPRGHPVRWALAAVAAVTAVCAASLWFGALTPRLRTEVHVWTADGAEVRVDLAVTNVAHAGMRLDGAGEPVPGLALVRTTITRPVALQPGEGETVTLTYRVTDCARIPPRPPAIPLHATTVLGIHRTVDGPASFTTDDSGAPVPWTADLTRSVCR